MNKIIKILIVISHFISAVNIYATELSNFVNKSKCNQIIEKQLYKICYSYKYKGALSGWVTLKGENVDTKNDIKKRPKFYNEKTIPLEYRTKSKDYLGYGKKWNRGHFIVADADFDYDKKALNKAYTMANIIPQAANVNQKTWIKVERYGRLLAKKFGYINSISIAIYNDPNNKIGNNIVIPSILYRIYYNNETNFEKCFMYENILNVNYKSDKLRNHEINCKKLKIR